MFSSFFILMVNVIRMLLIHVRIFAWHKGYFKTPNEIIIYWRLVVQGKALRARFFGSYSETKMVEIHFWRVYSFFCLLPESLESISVILLRGLRKTNRMSKFILVSSLTRWVSFRFQNLFFLVPNFYQSSHSHSFYSHSEKASSPSLPSPKTPHL